MKKKISNKLKILLCFGVILFTALGFSPTTASAHHADTGGREPSKVYDADNPWDWQYVGWFQHDKEVSPTSTGIWYDRQAYVTTYSVPEHYVPADAHLVRDFGQDGPYAPECTESGMKDSFYLFDKRDVFIWASQVNATPDNDGTLHVWVQPAIGTKTKKNGVWVDDGVTLMNLGAWEKAKTWGNSSTFASHYNKELKIKMGVPGGVTVKYQTLNAGDGYNGRQDILPNASYSYNVGSVHSYSETGIKSHIDWNVNSSNKRMVLVGVEVTKDSNSQTGTSGLLCSCISDSNRVEVGKSYNLWQDGLGDVGSHANSGYSFNKDQSDIYNFMVRPTT